jgi:manganese-dependent inorganic pyrophosphatase
MATPQDRHDPWDPEVTYVVGHQRPDTDALASALGYAWYLAAAGQEEVRPARAGNPTLQTRFALQRFGLEPPALLSGVAATFGHAALPQTPLAPDAPLASAMAAMGDGARVVPVVDEDERPLGVVTPMALARAYAALSSQPGTPAPSSHDMMEAAPSYPMRERISDHRRALLRMDADDFLVTDDAARYLGVATRARVLEPPRARLVLVDHNELSQSVPGAEEAEIVAVLDHHRLGNPPTAAPIPFVIEPVGSTCTLVAEQCRLHRQTPPAGLAGMMLSGILSDTLALRSPTTTARDHAAAGWLAELAEVEMAVFGAELLHTAPGLAARTADETLDADRKSYLIGGKSVSIAQVEVTSLQELPDLREALLAALEALRERESLALIGLMVTDIVTGQSRLLCRGDHRLMAALPFPREGEHEFDLGPILSRKKQLVPALVSVLEEAG